MLSSVLALCAFAPRAAAQATTDQVEYREFEHAAEERLTVEGSFETRWYEYSNLDFRPLDESSDQAILDSDDRGGFPFTGASLGLTYEVEPGVRFSFAGSHQGLWGDDQIGNNSQFGGMLYVTSLNMEFTPKPDAEAPLRLMVGRKSYKLGGLADAPDYILRDILDFAMVEVPIGVGTLEVIPVNVISQTDNDGLDFVQYMGTSDLPTFNFRGQTMMRRHGGVVRLDELPGPVDALAYGFYTVIGTGVSAPDDGLFSTGADITYQGLLGNFADGDWVANFGLRASAEDLGVVRPYAHLDVSRGIDHKELIAVDVDTNGLAWGAGLSVVTGEEVDEQDVRLPATKSNGIRARAGYFDAFGPAYNSDGMLFSHGYVSMKGDQAGGMLFNRFLGFHPTAYVSLFGVTDLPHDPAKRSGTRVLDASFAYDFGKPVVKASWWFLQDTGLTALNLSRLDQIDPPFGYSRDEFRAEERMGLAIGQELNLDAAYAVTDHVTLFGGGGVILPGPYYAVEVARVAGDALGSSDPAMPWGAQAGLTVGF